MSRNHIINTYVNICNKDSVICNKDNVKYL